MIQAAQPGVLVIDDDRGPRESLRILLKPQYQVYCADSVDAGMEMLKAHRPDTVIMDIRMPGKSGIEGLRAIRDIDTEVSVIMFTGYGALETAQEAIRLGANDYLKKPFDAYQILEVIKRHVQRTQMERRRRNAENELIDINRTLKDELTRKSHLATLGQKSAELVHDLRNPLGIVLGYVGLLEAELKKAKAKLGDHWQEANEYLESIEQGALRCRGLADMWLDISRGRMNRTAVDIQELLRAAVSDCQYLADQQRVKLTIETMGVSGTMDIDRLQVSRALQNLLTNAIEAVEPDSGCVHIWCRESTPNTVEFGILDNGCGMNREQLQHVFEPFYTTKKGTGTGLGLFIVQQTIEAHGGTVVIESVERKGTKILIDVPRYKV